MFVSIYQNSERIKVIVTDEIQQYAATKEICLTFDNHIRSILVLKEIVYLAFLLQRRLLIEKSRVVLRTVLNITL